MSHRVSPFHCAFRRGMNIGVAIACCMALQSCTGLMAQKAPDLAVSKAEPTVLPSTPSPMAMAVAQNKGRAYTDPLVSKKQQTPKSTRPAQLATQNSKSGIASETPAEQVAAAQQQPQNSLANVIQQPTAVQAGQNSIFAIANAKVAEAQGVPAYAPVKNINPMAGSVFSARMPASPSASGANAGADKNGLW